MAKLHWLPVILVSFLFGGCGGDGPGSVPFRSGPVGGGDRAPDPLPWEQLTLKWGDVSSLPGECMSPRQFTVFADGKFTYGPCHRTSTEVERGRLEAEELERLTTLIEAISSRVVNHEKAECEPVVGIPTDLRVTDGTGLGLDLQTTLAGERCIWGGKAKVTALIETFAPIAESYYEYVPPPPPTRPVPSPQPSSEAPAPPTDEPEPAPPAPEPEPTDPSEPGEETDDGPVEDLAQNQP